MEKKVEPSAMTDHKGKSDFPLSENYSEVDLQKNDGQEMEKTVGLVGGISLIVGTMIGSGIFASASAVAEYSVSVGMTLIVWVGCGILAMLASLCYIELGVSIPKSGGEYSYLLEAFGEIPAFLFSFVSAIILRPASVAAIVLATGNYIVEPFFGLDCEPTNKILIAKMLAAAFLGERFLVINNYQLLECFLFKCLKNCRKIFGAFAGKCLGLLLENVWGVCWKMFGAFFKLRK